MNIKRKELACTGGKVTIEEFHDGYRMHIAIIAERLPAPVSDDYSAAYREAGIPIKAERREIRFSVSNAALEELLQAGRITPTTPLLDVLSVLGRLAWARKNDLDPVWPTFTWDSFGGSTYGYNFSSGPPSEGLDH